MMNKFFDLRFVIGIFFFIIGILLLIHSFTNPTEMHAAVNRWSAIAFLVFATTMLLLSIGRKPKDKF